MTMNHCNICNRSYPAEQVIILPLLKTQIFTLGGVEIKQACLKCFGLELCDKKWEVENGTCREV